MSLLAAANLASFSQVESLAGKFLFDFIADRSVVAALACGTGSAFVGLLMLLLFGQAAKAFTAEILDQILVKSLVPKFNLLSVAVRLAYLYYI